jgi:integrase
MYSRDGKQQMPRRDPEARRAYARDYKHRRPPTNLTAAKETKLRLPEAFYSRLMQEARQKGLSLNSLMTTMLQTGFDEGAVEKAAETISTDNAPERSAPPPRTNDSKMIAEYAELKAEVARRAASHRASFPGKLSVAKIDRLIKQAKDGKLNRRMIGDGYNLYLQITNNGAGASWIFRWTDRVTGRDRPMGLGSYYDVNLNSARAKAHQYREMLKDGKDPGVERDNERLDIKIEIGRAKTVSQVTEEFYEEKLAPTIEPSTRKQVQVWLKDYVHDTIGTMAIQKVDTKTILEMVGLKELWTAMYPTATQLRSLLDRIFKFAIHKGYYRGESPAAWDGHLEYLLPHGMHQKKHHPYLPFQDVGRFMERLRAYVDPRGKGRPYRRTTVSLAVEFVVLTGVRGGEVLKAQWKEIDIPHMVWNVPWPHRKEGKSFRESRPIRPIPITRPMLVVLEEMQKRRIDQTPDALVFPGQWSRKGGSLNRMNFNQFIPKQLKWEGPATLHGFRSTLKDWCRTQTDINEDWYEIQFDHALGNNTGQSYGHDLLLDDRRRMMERWGEYCSRPAPEPKAAEVVNLSDKRRPA